MLQKEKTKLDWENCYLLGKSNHGYGLVYLLENDDEYELIYRDENEYINQIDTFGGYRLYEPREIYNMLGEFVLTDEEISKFNKLMYEYHAALAAQNIAARYSRFENYDLYQHYEGILEQIRTEIDELLSPKGEQND